MHLLKQQNIWCARDILDRIKSSTVPQEIGSHSFSHVIFGDVEVTRKKAIAEFTKGREILKRHGETPVSFVFPRNSVNYLTELAEAGFRSYRGPEPLWYNNFPNGLRKICHMADQFLAVTPPVAVPEKIGGGGHEGLINIPASMLYLPMHGFRKYIPLKSRTKKALKGIQKAITEKKIFHLWFHPFNIATDQKRLLKGLETIFEEVAEVRGKDNIEVLTMREIAGWFVNKYYPA